MAEYIGSGTSIIAATAGAKIMIKDAKGRKWFMRFKRYRQGWHWDARHGNCGQSSGRRFFKTKALAEADARRVIPSHDAIAIGAKYLAMHGNDD